MKSRRSSTALVRRSGTAIAGLPFTVVTAILDAGAVLGVYIGGPTTQETPEGYRRVLGLPVRDRIDEAVAVAKFYDAYAKKQGLSKGVSFFEIDFNNGGDKANIAYIRAIQQRLDAA